MWSIFIRQGKLGSKLFVHRFRANVLVTDLPEMIPLIKRNVSRNKEFLSGQVQVRAFEWGSDIAQLQQPNFDMVLAADCIYYEKVTQFDVA